MGKNSKKNYLVPFEKSAPISIYPIRTKKSENSGTADHAFLVNRNLNYELSLYFYLAFTPEEVDNNLHNMLSLVTDSGTMFNFASNLMNSVVSRVIQDF